MITTSKWNFHLVETIGASSSSPSNFRLAPSPWFLPLWTLLKSLLHHPPILQFFQSQQPISWFPWRSCGLYASFMKEIVEKVKSRNVIPPVLRITAIVPEEFAIESRLIRENLRQFAQDLKIRFHIDLVPLRTF